MDLIEPNKTWVITNTSKINTVMTMARGIH